MRARKRSCKPFDTSPIFRCEAYLTAIKWRDGNPCCVKCGSVNVVKLKTRSVYQCRERGCRAQTRLKTGTIFEDSPLTLDKWFIAAWMLASCRNGLSSHELARTIGVKQQSAWHMLHRLREVLKPGGNAPKLKGCVEVDESMVGGAFAHMHAKKRRAMWKTGKGHMANRTIVQAFLERGGEVRAFVAEHNDAKNLARRVRDTVERHSFVYTDALMSYAKLNSDFVHRFVNHMHEYVRGNVNINGIECYFSCLRRAIGGTYVSVEPEHLEAYCDEQAYRYTYRKDGEWQRFDRLMHRVVGKRLTYSRLTDGAIR